ncbi:MAG: PTS IIA-like nitrogen regulatory protein PtsN [Sphingomonadales bacterium]|nr:PTS IIA-like nitrogen regulatory protein PtsN [Sphingomonadales bacterium]
MEIRDLVSSDAVIPSLKANSKKQLLQELAAFGAKLTGQKEQEIFSVLLERERLGTTGVGHGVAIPHGKFSNLDKIYGVFAHMESPVDFESVDDKPVDLIFMLLVPEDAGADHLKALARISRLMRNKEVCEKLRGTDSADALYALLGSSNLGAS